MTNNSGKGVVLIVDDEPGVRALERRILEGGGYEVIEAGDGAEAVAMIDSSARVDFLVADLDMPVMQGEEMARKIRARRPDLRVLYVTAHSERLFQERPELIDGESFLDKPFTARGLLEAVSLLKTGSIGTPLPAPHPRSILGRLWRTVTGRDPARTRGRA
jgi:two-component system, cell cycle sensor histidine kinase and response regulator CckA